VSTVLYSADESMEDETRNWNRNLLISPAGIKYGTKLVNTSPGNSLPEGENPVRPSLIHVGTGLWGYIGGLKRDNLF
jgi:hypothetical protein